ncbi:MAG: hypothetical protein WBA29_12835 [Xanthobacteraceae bacterium]
MDAMERRRDGLALRRDKTPRRMINDPVGGGRRTISRSDDLTAATPDRMDRINLA